MIDSAELEQTDLAVIHGRLVRQLDSVHRCLVRGRADERVAGMVCKATQELSVLWQRVEATLDRQRRRAETVEDLGGVVMLNIREILNAAGAIADDAANVAVDGVLLEDNED